MVNEPRLINILIVDDSEDDRSITRRILEKHNFKVTEACSWMDTLEIIGKGGVDLVILDMRMPDIGGLELLGIIRKENPKLSLPVIVSSSYDANAIPSSEDANAFIGKYGDPEDLVKKIKEILKIT